LLQSGDELITFSRS